MCVVKLRLCKQLTKLPQPTENGRDISLAQAHSISRF